MDKSLPFERVQTQGLGMGSGSGILFQTKSPLCLMIMENSIKCPRFVYLGDIIVC